MTLQASAPLPLDPPRVADQRVPLAVKLVYTAFCAVMIPVYLRNHGPTNFIYFCDEAVLLTLVGVWLDSAFFVSMAAVGILLPQIVWVADLVGTAFGHPLIGMTGYMFDPKNPLILRSISAFHGWLPFLLVYLVYRLGYDRRALPAWTVLAIASMLVSYVFLPGPHPNPGLTPVNVDYVFGMSDTAPQTWMPGWAWLTMLILGLPAFAFVPTHLVLRRLFGRRPQAA